MAARGRQSGASLAAWLAVLGGSCARSEAMVDLTLLGFDEPAAVLHDPVADRYLVAEHAAAGGRIASVRPDGGAVDHAWIRFAADDTPLRRPTGMALVGDVLFVADVDRLHRFDRRRGTALDSVEVPGAAALAGLSAAPGGALWLADAGRADDPAADAGALFVRDPAGALRRVPCGPGLGRPVDVIATATGVYVAARDGRFLLVDVEGRIEVLSQVATGELAALGRPAAAIWLAASRAARGLYQFDLKGGAPRPLHGLDAGDYGDFDFDAARGRLLLPARPDRLLLRRVSLAR